MMTAWVTVLPLNPIQQPQKQQLGFAHVNLEYANLFEALRLRLASAVPFDVPILPCPVISIAPRIKRGVWSSEIGI